MNPHTYEPTPKTTTEQQQESLLEPMTFTAARWSSAGWDEVDKAATKILGAPVHTVQDDVYYRVEIKEGK